MDPFNPDQASGPNNSFARMEDVLSLQTYGLGGNPTGDEEASTIGCQFETISCTISCGAFAAQ